MTDWKHLLAQASPARAAARPTSSVAIGDAQVRLGHPIPRPVADLLEQTDGFHDAHAQYDPCWPLARLVEENLRNRRAALMPHAEAKLCFGDSGAGEPFLVTARTSASWDDDVLVWSWIDGEARRLASNLAAFWQGWLDGSISS